MAWLTWGATLNRNRMQGIGDKSREIDGTDYKLSQSSLFSTTYEHLFDISSLGEDFGKSLWSPLITPTAAAAAWRIELFPHGFDFKTRGFVGVKLHMCSTPILRSSCTVYLRNDASKSIEHETKAVVNGNVWEIPRWINVSQLSALGSTLCVGVHIDFFSACGAVEGTVIPTTTLQYDMLKLFNERRATGDVSLVSNSCGLEIKVHKLVLMTRSEYCKQQLQSRHKHFKISLRKPRINVDLPEGLLWEFVRYIYCDDMNFANKAISEVEAILKAANKLKLRGLVYRCEAVLSNILTAENVERMLVISKINQCEILRDNALALICKMQREEMTPRGYTNDILRSVNHIQAMHIREGWGGAAQKENVNHNATAPVLSTDKAYNTSPQNLEQEYECLGMEQEFIEDDDVDPRISRAASWAAPEPLAADHTPEDEQTTGGEKSKKE